MSNSSLPKSLPYPLCDLFRSAKVGTKQVGQSYDLVLCPVCKWIGSSAECSGGPDECRCPDCINVDCQEQLDGKSVFNVLLERLLEGQVPK